MRFTAVAADGAPIDFECFDTSAARSACDAILGGKTYPFLPFVGDVQMVFDVGAGCGAATVHFARHYRDAQIHAFEPDDESRAILRRNAAEYANVRVRDDGGEPMSLSVWAKEQGLGRVDVLTVDPRLGAAEVLEGLASFLPTVKVLYIGYRSRQARRDIARFVDDSHELYTGVMFLDRGQCIYLGKDHMDFDAAKEYLRQSFIAARAAAPSA